MLSIPSPDSSLTWFPHVSLFCLLLKSGSLNQQDTGFPILDLNNIIFSHYQVNFVCTKFAEKSFCTFIHEAVIKYL